MSNLISHHYIPYLHFEIKSETQDTIDISTQGKIKVILDENKYPFQKFSTEHKRFNIYAENSLFSLPEEFVIRVDEVTLKNVTAINIPLAKTLEIFLNLPGVYMCIKNYMQQLKEEEQIKSNCVQGKLWKRKYCVEGWNAAPICIFFDDNETGNGMGSHSGERKLGNVYCSLPCLPPHLAFKMTNAFLTTIFYTHHRTVFGNKAVFKNLISDLKYLSETGITVKVNNIDEKIYFDCVTAVGHNLGLNGCCGFQESFNGGQYCRICRANFVQCKSMAIEHQSVLRTRENYELDLATKTGGVNEKCIFNLLPNFHIAENEVKVEV